jgi:hypothetical protein
MCLVCSSKFLTDLLRLPKWRRQPDSPPTAMLDAMGRFASQHVVEAVRLGWTAEDLFGLNPYAPATRYDGRGVATMLSEGERVVELTSDAIIIEKPSGAKVSFQRNNGAPSVPAWKLR